jgi:hypothetical protein
VTAAGSKAWTVHLAQPASIEIHVLGWQPTDPPISIAMFGNGVGACGGHIPVQGGKDYTIYVTWFADGAWSAPDGLELSITRTPLPGVGVVRSGRWYLAPRAGAAANQAFSFGSASDTPLYIEGTVGPWIKRGSSWFPRGGHSYQYGAPTDVPVVGDWDGISGDYGYGVGMYYAPTIGVVRGGTWATTSAFPPLNGTTVKTTRRFSFGSPGDVFVAGDWNGDGVATPGVFRKGRWFFSNTLGGPATSACSFGSATDVAVVGDWNSDGIDTPGVFRNGRWFTIDRCGGPVRAFSLGAKGDKPIIGRWF